ncbi:large neutral amino acids transporter small subunit 3 isoform X2 [Lingula anatina]|uniref:Large neutral amino acids transporter small subunit 3 isoform X2 n=1 Tax=Lingula anatina TaxID=7574 RepID=A0A1S3JFQ5_LINAN|nr:large neutral amino acids transporter small subunit 3 isoform X2 [Lingula anatina]|eukprot:XP_013409232.1 large neutral amino acids transporter small subunit 3 isoform X2 [Lingula anatina]
MAVSACWKLFCVVLGILEAAIYSVTLYGWPAFMYIFIEEGFYYSRCDFDTVTNATYNMTSADCSGLGNCTQDTTGEDHVLKCTEQEEMLNLVYTIAMVGLVALFFLGYVYDHYGTVCLRIISICLCVGGVILMALTEKGTEWLLFPGAVFHLMGGYQLAITDVQVAALFPKLKATLTCLVSGAIDVSGFVPILLKMAYQAGVSYKTCMFTFAGIIFFLSSVNTITLPPRQDDDGNNIDVACSLNIRKRHRSADDSSKPNVVHFAYGNEAYDQNGVNESPTDKQLDGEATPAEAHDKNDHHAVSINTCHQHNKNGEQRKTCIDQSDQMVREVENPDSKDVDDNTNTSLLHGTLLLIRRPTFWLLLLWFICQDTIIVTYQGCFYAIINYYGNNVKSTVSTYTDVYSWFQVVSLFWALPTGLMLDRLIARSTKEDKERCFMLPLSLAISVGIVVSIACIIPVIEMHFVAIFFHSVLKTGSYAVHLAFVASVFPREHFGKAYGIQNTVSSLVNFINLPIFSWYKYSLESDPLGLGVLFLGICFTASSLPFYLLWHRCRSTQ